MDDKAKILERIAQIEEDLKSADPDSWYAMVRRKIIALSYKRLGVTNETSGRAQ